MAFEVATTQRSGLSAFKNKVRAGAFRFALDTLSRARLLKIGREVIEGLRDDSLNLNYINTLRNLRKEGVDINKRFVAHLSNEKATDVYYFYILVSMQRKGIELNGGTITSLTLEKAKDWDFTNAIFALKEAGVKVEEWIIHYLNLYQVRDKDFVGALVALQKSGIDVNWTHIKEN
jgi:hypothetical protein